MEQLLALFSIISGIGFMSLFIAAFFKSSKPKQNLLGKKT